MIDAKSFNYLCEIERRLTQTERNMKTVLRWMHENGHLDKILQSQGEHKKDAELSDTGH